MNRTRAANLFLLLFAACLLAALPGSSQNLPAAPKPQNPPAKQAPPPQPATASPAKAAQRADQVEDAPFKIRTRVELVVVPVTVKDAAGQLVTNLRQEEFRVLEDGVEQEMALFTAEAFPISAVVLLDDGLDTKTAAQLEQAAKAIAVGFSEYDEVAVLRFAEYTDLVLDFTTDNDKLFDHLKRLQVKGSFPGGIGSGPMTSGPKINSRSDEPRVPSKPEYGLRGSKSLDDAVYAAATMLKDRGRDRRKMIFLISDGANTGKNKMGYDETRRLLLSADISVYAVGVGSAALARTLNPLARYAHATGGDIYYASRRDTLESLFARVTEQARNQYTLAYAPKGTDRAADYHSIEVRIRRAGLDILTRSGYFRVVQP